LGSIKGEKFLNQLRLSVLKKVIDLSGSLSILISVKSVWSLAASGFVVEGSFINVLCNLEEHLHAVLIASTVQITVSLVGTFVEVTLAL
jgi:hypothetical protein